METVLIVEDDASLRLAMQKALRAAGYKVLVAKAGDEGLEMALSELPDCVLLDVMMPGKNGFEVLEALRSHDADLPVVMITAKGEEEDKVRGLQLGADEYVVKPVGVAELQARVGAALRRKRSARAKGPTVIGKLTVDFESHTATHDGTPVEITAHELKLLDYFLRSEGRLLPRQQILDRVWGADYFGTDRTVDNFISRLRDKIERDPKAPVHIVTVRGAGYRFHR